MDQLEQFASGTLSDKYRTGVEWLGENEGFRQLMCKREFNHEGYFGNEASTAEFYTKVSAAAPV